MQCFENILQGRLVIVICGKRFFKAFTEDRMFDTIFLNKQKLKVRQCKIITYLAIHKR